MNRQVKFRGQRVDNGEWIYGDLTRKRDNRFGGQHHYIFADSDDIEESGEEVLVDAETVGQFTGLKDKNGVDIYEGDIVKTDFKKDGSHVSIQVIEFYEGSFGSRNQNDHFRIPALFSGRATEGMNVNYYEVIGSIHSNPELIK